MAKSGKFETTHHIYCSYNFTVTFPMEKPLKNMALNLMSGGKS